jgi:hypothetical protein
MECRTLAAVRSLACFKDETTPRLDSDRQQLPYGPTHQYLPAEDLANSTFRKWIENFDSRSLKTLHVAGSNRQIMAVRGRAVIDAFRATR